MLLVSLLKEEARRLGAVDVGDATDLAKDGVSVLFDAAGGAAPGETGELLVGMSASLAHVAPGAETQGIELAFLVAILATQRLVAARRIEEEKAAALYMMANGADDELVKRSGRRYFLRTALVCELYRGLSQISDSVRHIDLVVGLKWGLIFADLDHHGVYGDGLTALRELPDLIAHRIEETHDGDGDGPTPSGRPLDPRRVAGSFLQAPRGAMTMQRYRSLPRLEAEARFELGRLLPEMRFGASESNLEEAHRQLDRAAIAYFATREPALAAISGILATECLDRILELAGDPETRRVRLEWLIQFGASIQRQIAGTELPAEEQAHLDLLVMAISPHALLGEKLERLSRRAGDEAAAELRAIVGEHAGVVNEYLMLAVATHKKDPWPALVALSAYAVEGVGFLSAIVPAIVAGEGDPEGAFHAFMRKDLSKSVDVELLAMFVDVIAETARDLQEPQRATARPLARGLRRHPLASPRRVFEGVGAFLRLAGAAGQPLSQAQWDLVAAVLDPIGIAPVPFAGILALQQHETSSLGCSLSGGIPNLSYFERRIHTIETAMADPLLSAAERAVLSGWLWRLATWFRPSSDAFRALPAERALWFLERFGAAAYRADALWFGRGEVVPPPFIGLPPGDFVLPTAEASPTATAHAWTVFHHGREQLDLWGRFLVAEEVRRVNPYVNAAFSGDLAQPTRTTITFPRDLSPAEQDDIERVARVTRDRWTVTESFIMVDIQPQGHDHVCALVDHGRGALTMACRELTRLGQLDHATSLPDIDPGRLRAFLLGPPARAVVVTEMILPVPVPLIAFFGHGGEITRHDVGSVDEKEENGAAFRALCNLREAIQADRQSQGQATFDALGDAITALEDALRRWSEELAERLGRAGVTEIVFLLRGIASAPIPWEDLPAGGGARLGDRFAIAQTHTLASLPAASSPARRGVVQIYGDGVSTAPMQPAAAMMRSLAAAGIARPPLGGHEACDGPPLWSALATAERLRFFLHGYHHPTRPTADRLTLVDLMDDARDVHLSPEIIHTLPLRDLRCAELWACEGAAHGRHIMEHGVADEPEDLTTAFLLAGARQVLASRWHVPALPSALLMERFALLVDSGTDEARALATARRELREAFSSGGAVEAEIQDRLLQREPPEAGDEDLAEHAFTGALHALRVGWYRARGLPEPAVLSFGEGALGRLVRFVPPRTERVAEPQDAVAGEPVPVGVRELLRSLRNPACWAGWGLTLRSIDAWDV
jgi:CHAT domain-containing protein